MSDGLTEAYRTVETTPDQEMEYNLKLLDYHYIEIGKLIQDMKTIVQNKKEDGTI